MMLVFINAAFAIEQQIPLAQSGGGTLYLEATLESRVKAKFLLDTGSSLLTLNQETFDALTHRKKRVAIRISAASL